MTTSPLAVPGTVAGAIDATFASLLLDAMAGVLGLAVGYVAFVAYRRNESLPMLFVAAGFLLTFWAPVFIDWTLAAIRLGVDFSPAIADAVPAAADLAARTSEVIGLLLILYGLAMPIRR